MNPRGLAATAAVLSALPLAAAGCTLLVSRTRPDAIASLAGARDAVRALSRPLPPGGVTVCVEPGLYTEPLVLDERDSGDAADRRVTWVGVAGDSTSGWPRAEFTGGVRITFTPPADNTTAAWTASLPSFGVTNYGVWQPHGFLLSGGFSGCSPAPLELFSDGAAPGGPDAPGYGLPQTVARWPNVADPSALYSAWSDEASWSRAQYRQGEDTLDSALFAAAGAPFGNWSASIAGGGVYATGYPWYDWADATLPVTGFNSTTSLLSLQAGLLPMWQTAPYPASVTFSAKYFLQNAREALDAPNEYWVDNTTGTIFFIPPPEAVDAARAAGTPLAAWVSNMTANPLVSAQGLQHVSFANLSLSFVRGSAMEIVGCNDVQVADVTIIGTGGGGISVLVSNNTVVSGASIAHTGGSGIDVYGGGDRNTLTSSGNVVVDCTVTHVGRRCLSYQGGITVDSIGAVVAHNAVSGTPHIGANVGTNDGLFEFNVLTDTVLAACDMGAFYTGATDWSVWNATVRYNAIYRPGYSGVGCNMQSGSDIGSIYFDEGQSGISIYGNLHWAPNPFHDQSWLSKARETYAHIVNGGSSVSIANELTIDANISMFQSIWGLSGSGYTAVCAANGSRLAGMRAMNWSTGIYAQRYPDLAALHDYCDPEPADCATDPACPAAPYRGSFTNVASVNTTGVVIDLGHNASVFDPSHFNFTGQWQGLDPGFAAGSPAAARATLSFQLANDSAVYAALPGFQRLPIECMGPDLCVEGEGEEAAVGGVYPRAAHIRRRIAARLQR